jgi:hypothetical protein
MPDIEVAASESAATASVVKRYALPPEAEALALAMQSTMDSIRFAPLPSDADLPPLSRKQLDRIGAFGLRDEFRKSR